MQQLQTIQPRAKICRKKSLHLLKPSSSSSLSISYKELPEKRKKQIGGLTLPYKPRKPNNCYRNRLTFGPKWSFNDYFDLKTRLSCNKIVYLSQPSLENDRTKITSDDIYPRDRFIHFRIFSNDIRINNDNALRIFVHGKGIKGESRKKVPVPFLPYKQDYHFDVDLIETSTMKSKKSCDICKVYYSNDKDIFGTVKTHPLKPYEPQKTVDNKYYFDFHISFTCTSCCYNDISKYTSFFLKFTSCNPNDTFKLTLISSPFIILNETARNSKYEHTNIVTLQEVPYHHLTNI